MGKCGLRRSVVDLRLLKYGLTRRIKYFSITHPHTLTLTRHTHAPHTWLRTVDVTANTPRRGRAAKHLSSPRAAASAGALRSRRRAARRRGRRRTAPRAAARSERLGRLYTVFTVYGSVYRSHTHTLTRSHLTRHTRHTRTRTWLCTHASTILGALAAGDI